MLIHRLYYLHSCGSLLDFKSGEMMMIFMREACGEKIIDGFVNIRNDVPVLNCNNDQVVILAL